MRITTPRADRPLCATIRSSAFARVRSEDVYLGKSSDIDENQREQYVLQKATTETGGFYLSLRWVGNVWTEVGLNSFGLAVGGRSGPVVRVGQIGYGIPQHTVLSPVLGRCRNVEEALELLSRTAMTGKGKNIVLADAEGKAAVVDKVRRSPGHHSPERERGSELDTNHCVTDALQGTRTASNSLDRCANLERLLAAPRYADPVEDLKDIYADHAEPGAICQHGQDGLFTLVTSIADPVGRVLLVNGDCGCARAYRAFEL